MCSHISVLPEGFETFLSVIPMVAMKTCIQALEPFLFPSRSLISLRRIWIWYLENWRSWLTRTAFTFMDYLSFFTNRLFPCVTLQSHGYYSHTGISNIMLSNFFPMSGTFVWESCIPKHHLFTVYRVMCRALSLWSSGQKRISIYSKSLISTSVLLRDTGFFSKGD